jgi:hypothetical protein
MMIQSEWLACEDHRPILRMTQGAKTALPRPMALFACACCRMVWPCLDEDARRTVEQLERFADGEGVRPELIVRRSPAVGYVYLRPQPGMLPYVSIGSVVESGTAVCSLRTDRLTEIPAGVPGVIVKVVVADRQFVEASAPLFRLVPMSETPPESLPHRQADLVRDVFPYPFSRLAFPGDLRAVLVPALTPDVLALAQAVYAQKRLDTGELDNLGLNALADALEENGYADADVLAHLRSDGPHVRGCWALDLILGKSL